MRCKQCQSLYGEVELKDDNLTAEWVCRCGHRQTWEDEPVRADAVERLAVVFWNMAANWGCETYTLDDYRQAAIRELAACGREIQT